MLWIIYFNKYASKKGRIKKQQIILHGQKLSDLLYTQNFLKISSLLFCHQKTQHLKRENGTPIEKKKKKNAIFGKNFLR